MRNDLPSRIFRALADTRLVRGSQFYKHVERRQVRRTLSHLQVDCVFDVGANAGQYATMLRKHCGYRGLIVSFEPLPDLAQIVRDAAQGDPDWIVEEAALSDREGTARFNRMAETQFSSLRDPSQAETEAEGWKNQVTESIEVRTTTVAAALAKVRAERGVQRPFLKMDTQGHDLDIAKAAGEGLREFRGLQTELAIKRLYEGAPTFDECIRYYQSMGFELSALVPNNAGHFPVLLEVDGLFVRADLC